MARKTPAPKRTMTPGGAAEVSVQPRGKWILSPLWDSALFIGAPLVAVAGLLPLRSFWSSQDLSVFLLAFFTFGHHFPGFLRAYGDSELLARYRLRFLLAPPMIFAAALWFDLRDLHGLLIFISAWDIWHVLMQHYGFMRIYDAKAGQTAPLTAWADRAVSLSWYVALIAASPHYRHDLLRRAYEAGLPLLPPGVVPWLMSLLLGVAVVMTFLHIGYHVYLKRSGHPVSFQKLVMLGVFLAATWYLYVGLNDFLLGFGVWSAFHCLQYYGIVWVFNQNKVARGQLGTGLLAFLFRPSVGLVLLYSGLILAYGGLNYAVSFVSGEGWRRILMAFTFTSTALHYYYDGFIWKVRDPRTSTYLNIETTTQKARKAFASVADSMTAAAGKLRPVNNGWIQLAYLSIIVIGLGLVETVHRNPEVAMREALAAAAPEAGEPYFHLGDALWKGGRLEDAIAAHREAVRLMPTSAAAHVNLGAVLQDAGEVDEAIEQYRAALDIYARHSGSGGRSSGSVILPSAGVGESENDFAAHSNLADALARSDRQQEAIEHYLLALERDPDSVKVRVNLAATLSALERYDAAVSELNRVLELDPGYPAAHINLASILEFQGKTEEAARHYEAVLAGNDERAANAAAGALRRLRSAP